MSKEAYDKFRKAYAGTYMEWNYWSMPLDKLAKHMEYNEEAAQVYKTRSSKLGKYLEGHD